MMGKIGLRRLYERQHSIRGAGASPRGKGEKLHYGPVEPIIRMKNPDHYRNKVTGVFAVDYQHGGKPICGIGIIGICAADRARKVIGVEVNPEAVKDAIVNAQMNYGKQDEILPERRKEDGSCPDVVFVDPPRAGASENFLKALLKLKPKKIVYISCGPETLCRDLAVLCAGADYALAGQYAEQAIVRGEDPTSCIEPAGGNLSCGAYAMKKAVPVDMFPATSGHVETVALLQRRNS